MGQTVTLQEVRDFVRDAQSTGPIIGGCRTQSSKLITHLRDNGLGEEVATHHQSYFQGEAGRAEHMYVRVVLDETEYVLDPTVGQFTEDNYYERKADTYIPESEIPDVGVISPDMAVYSRYE